MTFSHTHPATHIVAGRDALAQLGELCDAAGVGRGDGRLRSHGRVRTTARRRAVCSGERLVEVFAEVRPHAGISTLQAGADVVREQSIDVLVSVGGGATMDSAKCISLLLARTAPLEDYRVQRGATGHVNGAPVPPTLTHVAIPTTAGSSSEIMPWAGIRDEQTRQKMLFRDPRLAPDIAVLDPAMVAPTGAELTSSSAVTSLARAIESLYSRDHQPFAEAYALQSLRLMLLSLPAVLADPGDLDARHATQVAATLSGIAADNAMVSVVHAVGHAVGGSHVLQHGVAHRILLPGAMARCLPGTGELQLRMAEAVGVQAQGATPDDAGRALTERIAERLLPTSSRCRVGCAMSASPRPELDDLVAHSFADPMFGHAPASAW